MTHKVQISSGEDRKGGMIVVVGGDTVPEALSNLQMFMTAPLGQDQATNDVLLHARHLLIPNVGAAPAPQAPVTTQQAVQNIQNAFPGAQVIAGDDPWAGMGPTTPAPQQQQWGPPAQQYPPQGQPQYPPQQGYPQQGYPQQQQQQYPQQDQRQSAGPPPGQHPPICPMHQQPARWVDKGKFGPFWGCAVDYKSGCKIPK